MTTLHTQHSLDLLRRALLDQGIVDDNVLTLLVKGMKLGNISDFTSK